MASEPTSGHNGRQLTTEEAETLKQDRHPVSDFKRSKLEQDAKKNWDLFYKRNSTHFFKDRHWLTREFPELLQALSELGDHGNGGSGSRSPPPPPPVFLEAGCGVGNTLFPLLEDNPRLSVYACDFSPVAVDLVKSHPAFDGSECHAFVCDLTTDQLSDTITRRDVDLASAIFVLSAITPEKMVTALTNIHSVLKPGGLLLFRDYGLYDHAMLRFGKGHKISEHFYVRQDGTRAFYFSEEKLVELVLEAGFEVLESKYVHRETVNRKESVCVPRVFVQGKFAKPLAK